VIELTIAALGAKGDGIAHHQGRDYFVPLAAPGDRVHVVAGAERREGTEARIERLIAPGPDRVEPPCRHFGDCGGCALQHLSDAFYARWKAARLTEALAAHGIVCAIEGMASAPIASRRRARFGVAAGAIGFRRRFSHAIVDIPDCTILRPALHETLRALRKRKAFPEGEFELLETEGGIDLKLSRGESSNPGWRRRQAALAEELDLVRLSLRGQDSAEVIVERREPWLDFGGVAVVPPPGGFVQPTREGEIALRAAVLEGVSGARRVVDLFAGCGTFALPLARDRQVHAVDMDAAALAALDRAGRKAGLVRLSQEKRDLFRRPLARDELKPFDTAIFDPPRAGAPAQAKALAQSRVACVVAVSCNPATLARDLGYLVAGGYRIERVVPYDQFRFTPHLETVAVLRRG